ncbi:MAG: SRPBCC family protein [Tepidisphaeraceae bacterium]
MLVTGLPNLIRGRGLTRTVAGAALLYRGLSGYCALYSALGLNTNKSDRDPNQASADPSTYNKRSIHVEQSITIQKSPEDLYLYWRDFSKLPQFMGHLKEVRVIDDQRSHWVAKAPLNFSVEWDAEIINEDPGRVIAWRSVGEADVDNSGSVRFRDLGNGQTEVKVVLDYIPPAGRLGSVVAKLFGEEPNQQIKDDLSRFKQQIESGQPDALSLNGRSL